MKPLPIQRNNLRHDGFDEVCDAWGGLLDEEAIRDLARVAMGLAPTDPTVVFLKSAGYIHRGIVTVPILMKRMLLEWKNTIQLNESSVLMDRINEPKEQNLKLRRSALYSKCALVVLIIGLVVGVFLYGKPGLSDVFNPALTPQKQLERGLAAVGVNSTVTDSESNLVIMIHTESSTDYRWDEYRRSKSQKDLRFIFYKYTLLPEN